MQVLNRDNDLAGINVIAAASLVTTESQGTAQFKIVLSNQPNATVSVALTSSNLKEGTVSPSSLVFTTTNWSSAQTVIATGVDDSANDGDVAYKISIDSSTSLDSNYRALRARTLDAVNQDNETATAVKSDTANKKEKVAAGALGPMFLLCLCGILVALRQRQLTRRIAR